MKKRLVLLAIGGSVLLASCHVSEIADTPQIHEMENKISSGEFRPNILCPFSVDIYPEILYVGDPLYVRMNFFNNTNLDTYAHAGFIHALHVASECVAFDLLLSDGNFIPWWHADRSGAYGSLYTSLPPMQKINPGAMGQTQYMMLVFPGLSHTYVSYSVSDVKHLKNQWQAIKGFTAEMYEAGLFMSCEIEDIREAFLMSLHKFSTRYKNIDSVDYIDFDDFDKLDKFLHGAFPNNTMRINVLNETLRLQDVMTEVAHSWRTGRTRETRGQLVVSIRISKDYILHRADLPSLPPHTNFTPLMVCSSSFVIKPRSLEEMKILDKTLFNDDWEAAWEPNRHNMECLISGISPGTLQNLLKYKLLVMELAEEAKKDELLETRILETLEKMEQLMATLHTIERENWKLHRDPRRMGIDHFIQARIRDSGDKAWKKFVEIFGEKPLL